MADREAVTCPQCGKTVQAEDRFCGECGETLKKASTAPKKPAPTPARSSRATVRRRRRPRPSGASSGSGRRIVVPLVIALLLAGGGALALTSGLFGGAPVEAWSGATTVNALVDGRVPMKTLAERFGQYDEVGTYADNREWVLYRPSDPNIKTVTAWLDAERIARWIRIEPAGPAPLESVLASLSGLERVVSIVNGNWFGGRSGLRGKLYSGGTAYAYAVDDDVEEIWLIPFDVRHEDVIRAVHGTPPVELDVSGTGIDPRR